jgi:hypothetical protein
MLLALYVMKVSEAIRFDNTALGSCCIVNHVDINATTKLSNASSLTKVM